MMPLGVLIRHLAPIPNNLANLGSYVPNALGLAHLNTYYESTAFCGKVNMFILLVHINYIVMVC